MERLTVKRSDGRWALANNDGAKPLEQMEKIPIAIDRLAAYEDSGLTPQEIEIQQIALSQCKPYIDAICDKRGTVLINPIRLAELAQAEKDGRLVVLPCNAPPDPGAAAEDGRGAVLARRSTRGKRTSPLEYP